MRCHALALKDVRIMNNRVPQATAEQPTTQPLPELTWSQLMLAFFKVLQADGKGDQEANFKTAFKYFLISIGLTEESLVGAEFSDDEVEAKIKIYIEFEVGRKLQESTYNPRVSKIRQLKRFAEANFAERLQFQTLPQPFGKRLLKLIISFWLTVKSFWRTLPKGLVSYSALSRWCNEGYLPSSKSLSIVNTIETHLKVPIGTLRLSKYLRGKHHAKIGLSDNGNKTRATLAKPYYVWTSSLTEEYEKLVGHKTAPILPEGEDRHRNGQWTSGESEEVPSALMFRSFLQSFMGYCSLPKNNLDPYLRGCGLASDDLTLALLADRELVEDHMNFRRLRGGLRLRPVKQETSAHLPAHMVSADGKWEFYDKGGKYNNGSIVTLSHISSLLRPGTGYLYQHPEFAEKLGSRMTAGSWHEQCVLTRSRVNSLRRMISSMKKENDEEHFDYGRDPKERIEWILI